MAGSRGVRRAVRWGLRHGMIRRAIGKRAAAGDLGARLMVDPAVVAEPFAHYDELRTRGRLVDTGFGRISAHHDVVTAVLRSTDFGVGMRIPDNLPALLQLAVKAGGRWSLGPVEPPSMLAVDPPDHTRYRKLVTRAFTARAIAALRTRAEQIAADLLDALATRAAGDGRGDLIEDYAALLPATVIAEMLGVPVAMRRQFLEWGASGALSLDIGLSFRDFRRSERDIDALHSWMLGHFETIRRTPGDTILSALVTAYDEDDTLAEDELSSIAMLLLAAGFETTVNLIGSGAALLMAHPDQLAVLQAEPERWGNAIDEMLRIESPVQRTGRIACRDTEVAGQAVPAGTPIALLIGGANRDPAVFPDPARFDVTRPEAGRHVAFSSGVHYCLGAALARMEGEVALRALFDRFPGLAPAGPGHRRPTRVLRGYDALPVTLPAPVSA
ncbi:cytochrome P450 [Pseudonocardia asaccharolytica]|uniref:Putative cytochrome P450 140 n=1 Tax=Pseudonocardia asaccharolytica DSM 44247 = NBRC 16224 TaxID=1123024 RepID=A0A511D277_9PSEU|nr:cytochrome P450 [Pseudonocardia asaccharolytica]GEL18886.1 putative cytochrome P450 140 [Pseudonocardia asaccharolytica DSM 44247 = NBRC 16224]